MGLGGDNGKVESLDVRKSKGTKKKKNDDGSDDDLDDDDDPSSRMRSNVASTNTKAPKNIRGKKDELSRKSTCNNGH